MMRSILFGIAALALAVTTASAEDFKHSANYFMPHCRNLISATPPGSFLEGRCGGIIEGINYMDGSVCSPKEVTGEQLVRVVVAYIDARPARMHESFPHLVVEALRDAWPCK